MNGQRVSMDMNTPWTDADFAAMSWHDARLYSFGIPDEQFQFSIDIDYIFSWDEVTQFTVAPCSLTFFNVSDFSVKLDFSNHMLLYIVEVKKTNPRLSPNEQFTMWDYDIQCDHGAITFSATHFEMALKELPAASEEICLGRSKG